MSHIPRAVTHAACLVDSLARKIHDNGLEHAYSDVSDCVKMRCALELTGEGRSFLYS